MTTIEDTQAMIRALHEIPGCETGGPLHITTDDANVDDHHLDFCEKALRERVLTPAEVDAAVAAGAFRPHAQYRGWWRTEQTAAQSAEMERLGQSIIDAMRPMTLAAREAVCRGW